MKKLIAFVAALCIAAPAMAAPKKDAKEKDKKKEKEVPAMMWSVVVEGARAEVGGEEVKGFLSGIKGVKVESCEQKEKTVEAVISSKERVSRSDVSKALKENKDLKVKDFKVKRPDKDGEKKEAEKKPAEKKESVKEEPAKTEPAKAGDKKEEPAGDKEMKEEKPEVK